jgi:hypothetical protein
MSRKNMSEFSSLATRQWPASVSKAMKKPLKDPMREERIRNEAIVHAYGSEEKAMPWYEYLENSTRFPFRKLLRRTGAHVPAGPHGCEYLASRSP